MAKQIFYYLKFDGEPVNLSSLGGFEVPGNSCFRKECVIRITYFTSKEYAQQSLFGLTATYTKEYRRRFTIVRVTRQPK